MDGKYNHLFKIKYYDKNHNLIKAEYLILESSSEMFFLFSLLLTITVKFLNE